MASRSRSPSLSPDGSSVPGCLRESLPRPPRDVPGGANTGTRTTYEWNAGAQSAAVGGAGYVSLGGVRYGVRLAADKYSAGPRRALSACCGQSRAACCRARQARVRAKPDLPACLARDADTRAREPRADCRSSGRRGDTTDCQSTRRQGDTADCHSRRQEATADSQSSRPQGDTADYQSSRTLQETEDGSLLQDTNSCLPISRDTSASSSLQGTSSCLYRSKDVEESFCLQDTSDCCPRRQDTSESLSLQETASGLPRSKDTTKIFSVKDTNSCLPRSQTTYFQDANHCLPRSQDTSGSFSLQDTNSCSPRSQATSLKDRNSCSPRTESLSSEDTVKCFRRNHTDSGSHKNTIGCLPRSESLSSEDTVNCFPRNHPDSGSNKDTFGCLPRNPCSSGSLSSEDTVKCLPRSNADSGYLSREDTIKCLPRSEVNTGSLSRESSTSCLTKSGQLPCEDTAKCLPKSPSASESLCHRDKSSCLPKSQTESGSLSNEDTIKCLPRSHSRGGSLSSDDTNCSQQVNVGNIENACNKNSTSVPIRNASYIGNLCNSYKSNSHQNNIKLGDLFHPDSSSSQQRNTPIVGSLCKIYTTNSPQRSPVNLGPFNNKGTYTTNGSDVNNKEALTYYNRSPSGSVNNGSHNWANAGVSNWTNSGPSSLPEKGKEATALDRLQRFRFGGRSASSGERKARPDKTERLRELTDRLRGKPPPPLPPPRLHRQPRSTPEPPTPPQPPVEDTFDPLDCKVHRAEARTIVGSYAQRTIPFRSASFSQVDFNAIDGKYIRSDPKLIPRNPTSSVNKLQPGGTIICEADLTLPRKKETTSRSLVKESAVDIGSTPSVDSAVGSDEGLNSALSRIPTVVPDLSHKPAGARSLTHPLPGRSSSVDGQLSYSSSACDGRKSLQYFPNNEKLREVREESDVSLTDSAQAHSDNFSPVDGSLGNLCAFDFPIPVEQKNESERLSLIRSESDDKGSDLKINVTPECSRAQIFIETPEGKVLKTATASVIPVPVYECIVREWSSIPSEQWLENKGEKAPDIEMIDRGPEAEDKKFRDRNFLEAPDDETITSEQVENLLASVQNASKLQPSAPEEKKHVLDKSKRRKGIYITKWPIHDEISGLILPESVISAQFNEDVPNGEVVNLETGDREVFIGNNVNSDNGNNKNINRSRTLSGNLSYLKTDSAKKPGDSVRWTGQDTACIWSAPQDEPLSPEIDERSPPQWPKSLTEPRWNSRPALTYQSSEEKEDYGVPKVNNKKISLLARADSLSEGESECGSLSTPVRDRTASPSPFNPSDLSDNESRSQSTKDRGTHVPRRYSKRPLRGPYGQMLEAEMKKPELCKLSKHDEELKFLDDLVASPPLRPRSPDIASSRSSLTSSASVGIPEPRITVTRTRGAGNHSLDDTHLKSSFGLSSSPTQKPMIRASPKRKVSANIPYSAPNPVTSPSECVNRGVVFHQRTTSSPSKLEGFSPRLSNEVKKKPEPSVELLAELLRGSSERLSADASLDRIPFQLQRFNDTRTHVVVELYDTERSYVEALQILVVKYLHPLKSPENVGLVDAALVDEIFFQVPAILALHEVFLEELRRRLELWDVKQKVGDVFLNVFTKPSVMEMYTGFINNWKKAKETIKATSSSRPAFARFLEAMARDHKGKLSLDNLLIKPVQKFPRYELLIQRLIKHTEPSHPDHQLLIDAQKEIHELLVRINCTERESLELEQQQQTLRELESLVEGLANLVAAERSFLRHDTVSMPSGQGATKERALFLFSDLLLITSIKRRTGTIRKPSSVSACPGSLASTLDANKYKLLMRISLDDLEILKAKDENLRRIMREMETLSEDVSTLTQIGELTASLHCGRGQLEELVREMLQGLARQLAERQGSDAQLAVMELALNTSNGIENLSIIFSKPEKRTSWEEIFNEAKQKIALSDDKRPAPEFVTPVPIRKTRAGLQFTCAAPTLALAPNSTRDVWVCNSDGYVGQVCVLTLHPEPQVTSCNGVCNARILCVACIPPPPPAKAPSPVPPTVEATNNAGSNRQNFSNSKTGISISIQDADDGNQNIRLESSSSSEDDDEGSSAGENPNENQLGNNTNNSATSNPAPTTGVQNNQNKSGSNAQNIPVNPVMKSSSNPNVDKTAMGITTGTASPKQSIDESSNCNQPTMWLGTEDGCIHVYNCSDNIRIKKNKIKIQHGSGVHCIVYVDNRIFVSLANGDIIVYVRDNGGWKEHTSITVGTVSCPVTRLLLSGGKLWCAQYTNVKIINPNTVQVEDTITVSNDPGKPISHIAISGVGVWVALSNAAVLKCFHANTKEMLTELNIAPAVTKMLAGCDDIIRQHKAACLRVTSLLACRELLWIGTSAGVLLTAPAAIPNPPAIPTLCGVPQGHTGHVRFLTVVEASSSLGSLTANLSAQSSNQKQSLLRRSIHSPGKLKSAETSSAGGHLLVISGGDGYEDFRSSGVSEIAGREDSTNHLLLWRV